MALEETRDSKLAKKSSSFVRAREASKHLQDLYRRAGLSLNSQCSLGLLIKDATALADAWEGGAVIDDEDPVPLIRGQQLDKIAWAALPLETVEGRKTHLHALKCGCLDPLKRDPSKAKDKLWELELWTALSEHGMAVSLEEPDIVANMPSGRVAIACKRIYSLPNAASSMSNGVSQIKSSGLTGILAVNIDDVVIPPGFVLAAPNIVAAADQLNAWNTLYLGQFERALTGYVSTGRVAAVMVSCAAPLFLEDQGIRECRQSLVWSHPSLEGPQATGVEEFRALLLGASPHWESIPGATYQNH